MIPGIVSAQPLSIPDEGGIVVPFSDVVFLSDFDEYDNATWAFDRSPSLHAMTFVGDAKVSGGRATFAGAGKITVPSDLDFMLGAGPFCIEFSFQASSLQNATLLGVFKTSALDVDVSWRVSITSAGNIVFQCSDDGDVVHDALTGSYLAGVPYAVCVERNDLGQMHLYLNGARVDTAFEDMDIHAGSTDFEFGANVSLPTSSINNALTGWVGPTRISRAVRYNSTSYAVPAAFPPYIVIDWLPGFENGIPDATSPSTTIANLIAVGPQGEDASSFVEVADPDGKFSVSGSTLVLDASLDHTVDEFHELTLQATGSEVFAQPFKLRVSPFWVVTYQNTLNADNSGWNGFNLRQLIAASLTGESGSAVRLYMRGGSAAQAVVDAAHVQHGAASGDAFDFEAASSPVAITVGGSGSFTLTAGALIVSDEIAFAYDHTKPFLAAFHFNATSTVRQRTSVTNATRYHRSAAAETSVVDVSSYTSASSTLAVIEKIEVLQT